MTGLKVDPYEKGWMVASAVILVVFLLAVGVTAFNGFTLPGHEESLKAMEAGGARFPEPGVVQRGPGRYDVYMRAQIWAFVPNEIRVPAGSTLTFYLTTPDVQHGFLIERTNVNLMALPGQIARSSARFATPGEYRLFCHEYCGLGHQIMWGKIIVEARSEETRR